MVLLWYDPDATPTSWMKKLTSNVQAEAKAILGNVSAMSWTQKGLSQICTGIKIARHDNDIHNNFRN